MCVCGGGTCYSRSAGDTALALSSGKCAAARLLGMTVETLASSWPVPRDAPALHSSTKKRRETRIMREGRTEKKLAKRGRH